MVKKKNNKKGKKKKTGVGVQAPPDAELKGSRCLLHPLDMSETAVSLGHMRRRRAEGTASVVFG